MRIIETKRLSIERATIEDQEFIFELLNSPTWIKYIGDRGIRSLDDACAYIEDSLIDSYQKHGFGLNKLVLKKNLSPIGLCGLLKRQELEYPDIGFALLPQFEGGGYGMEAATATLQHAKTELHFDRLMAITDPNNARSQSLLTKIGLIRKKSIIYKTKEVLLFANY